MIGAGLLAKKAAERGLTAKPWVKTSLAPGSKVVTRYLDEAGLTPYLDQIGFYTVGTAAPPASATPARCRTRSPGPSRSGIWAVSAVISGNRNFEGRVHPLVRSNSLASPPLVVAYALAGTVDADLTSEPLGVDRDGNPVYLRDLWPSQDEIKAAIASQPAPRHVPPGVRQRLWRQRGVERHPGLWWRPLPVGQRQQHLYPRAALLCESLCRPCNQQSISGAKALAVFGDPRHRRYCTGGRHRGE